MESKIEFKTNNVLKYKKLHSWNKIQSKTKIGQRIANNQFSLSLPMHNVKKTFRKSTMRNILDEYKGDKIYIVSGNVKVASNTITSDFKTYETKKIVNRPYSFKIKGKDNMTNNELREFIHLKLLDKYKYGTNGVSNNEVVGFNLRLVNTSNVNINRLKLFSNQYLKLKSLECDEIKVEHNCVFDYLLQELPNCGYKKITFDKLKSNMDDVINGDIFENGITLEQLIFFLNKFYKSVSYYVIGITNNIIEKKSSNHIYKSLVFKVNNNHLYPITSEKLKTKYTMNREEEKKEEKIKFDKWAYMEDDNLQDGVNYILNSKYDFNEYKQNIMEKSGYQIEYWRDGVFKHPTINCLIYDYNEYHKREKIYNDLKLNNLRKFANQSYNKIANISLNQINSIVSSHYNHQSYYYLSLYEPKPILDSIGYNGYDEIKGVDIAKHYTSIFYNNFQDKNFYIPIYDYYNYVKKYKGDKIKFGEYFIQMVEYKNIRFGGYFIHSFVCKRLLKMGVITKDDIKYYITTKQHYKPNNFKKFVEKTAELNDMDAFKKLNNMLNGSFNNKKNKIKNEYYFTNDIVNLNYLIEDSEDKKYEWGCDIDEGFNAWFKRNKITHNYENTSSYYRATLSCSILEVCRLMKKIKGYIIKVKTDAVYYIGENFKYDEYNDLLDSLGKYRREEVDNKTFYEDRYEPIEFKKYEHNLNNNILLGCGGYGKSYRIIEECDKEENVLFLTPTNATKKNLIDKIKLIKGEELYKVSTLHSFFESQQKINNYDKVIVDEIFMVSSYFMRKLILHNNIIFLGDEKQLPSIENSNIDILNGYVGKYFKKDIQTYTEGRSRYDKETNNIINNFVKSGYKFKKLDCLSTIDDNKIYDFYICHTNETRRKYIKRVCDYKHINKEEFKFKYQNEEEVYKIDVDMPIIATSNNLKPLVYNNWVGKIKEINDNYIIVNDEIDEIKLNYQQFKNNFIPFYASTIHKVQGQTINGDYAILEIYDNRTSSNLIYTAITRCKNYKQIHIYKEGSKIKNLQYRPHIYNQEFENMIMDKKKTKIIKAIIKKNESENIKYFINKVKLDKGEKLINKNILLSEDMDEKQANDTIYRLTNNNVVEIETIKNNVVVNKDIAYITINKLCEVRIYKKTDKKPVCIGRKKIKTNDDINEINKMIRDDIIIKNNSNLKMVNNWIENF